MDETIETLRAGGTPTLAYPGLYAAKLGPFPFPVRIAVRAYSNHHLGGATSTAWIKLYYDGALVGETDGTGDPIAIQTLYEVGLLGGGIADFRLETGNRISTIRNFGLEFTLSQL